MQAIEHSAPIPAELDGARLDLAAAQLFPDYSRSRLQKWVKEGRLTLDGQVARPRDLVYSGSVLNLRAELEESERWQGEDIALDIVYEDEHLLVINKPAGLVVHPAAGNADGTLLNAVLHHCPEAAVVPRGGIVHRLDKDTTGLMVVAKTLLAQVRLVEQLQERTVSREYVAVCQGVLTGGGTIETEMGRHPKSRQKMAVLEFGGKEAITHYTVLQRYRGHSLVKCKLETGRTHQIRVHMAHIHHPLIGDGVYGGRPKLPKYASADLVECLQTFPRQALHAKKLSLVHPGTGKIMSWEAPIPADLQHLIDVLAEDAAHE